MKCEMIWKIWKKSKLNSETYAKYRRKLWNDMENMDEMWNDMKNMDKMWNDMENMEEK